MQNICFFFSSFSNDFENKIFTSFTAADLASIGGLGGATVGRLMVGAGRKLIPSCETNPGGVPRIVPICVNVGPANEIGGDLLCIEKNKNTNRCIKFSIVWCIFMEQFHSRALANWLNNYTESSSRNQKKKSKQS